MKTIISWTKNNWLGLVLLAVVLTATITFGWWSYCCLYDNEVGLAIACISIDVTLITVAGLYVVTLAGHRVNSKAEKVVPTSAIITLIGCCLGLSNSCKAETTNESFLINQFQYIIDEQGEINWDAVDVDSTITLSDTTDIKTGRHWETKQYYINNTDSAYIQVETFSYKGETWINYIEYVAPKLDNSIKETVSSVDYKSGFKKHKSHYIKKEAELNSPFGYVEEESFWVRYLSNGKVSLLYTTM